MKKILWVIGALAAMAGLACGGTPSNDAGADPGTVATAEVPPPTTNKPAGPAKTFSDGQWTVGVDIAVGTYKSSGVDKDSTLGMCYWEITKTGSNGDIIKNDIVEAGRPTVTLKKGQDFESSGCGTWQRQS